ncbi:cytochrome P450 [Clavulina sp. PMI_390]|nr:cytochrome P450 [Clavulina sp. PMI_390]
MGFESNALVGGILLLAIAALLRTRTARKLKLPPGPSGLPWIGQGLEVPLVHCHLYYTKLRDIYGDICTVTAMGQKIVVLNTYKAVFELRGKHGAIHCDRPRYPFVTRFLGLEHQLVAMNAGPDWKEGRRLYQALLNKEVIRTKYSEDVASQARSYVLRVIEAGKDVDDKILEVAIHRVVLQLTYGLAPEADDPIMVSALHGTHIASMAFSPTKHLVNLFPDLEYLPPWVPFQTWRTEGAKMKKALDAMIDPPWDHTIATKDDVTENDCFTSGLLREETPANEHLLKILAGTNLMAGPETIFGVCQVFILAMLLHPEVQKKAQEELDQVIGRDRLPALDDQPNLPYLEAVIKEVLRWQPVAPLAGPSFPRKADTYQGYDIPHDAVVVQNTWAISRDERMYPNAESFTPHRWLVSDPPLDPRLWGFGIGRRVCPGMAYAEVVFTTVFMTLLATADIVHAVDENQKEIYVDPSIPTTGRMVSIPLPFSYSLRPRSEAGVSLLREALAV